MGPKLMHKPGYFMQLLQQTTTFLILIIIIYVHPPYFFNAPTQEAITVCVFVILQFKFR